MGQILHGSTTTTHGIRAAIQRSKAPLKDLAAQHGLNQKTISKWRKRTFVHDAPMGPKIVRSTVLTAEEEAMVVRSASTRCCLSMTGSTLFRRPSPI